MHTLVVDTETNGLPPRGHNNNLELMPYMAQLAAVLYQNQRPVASFAVFTVPLDSNGVLQQMPKEKFFIENNLTDEVIAAVGVHYNVALAMLNNLARRADRIVAHNMPFDDPIIRAAYMRSGISDEIYTSKPRSCTMKTLEPVMKLPSKWGKGYKYPSLLEAYVTYVDPAGFDGAHDALVDVQAAAKVLWAIEDKFPLWSLGDA